MISVQFFSEVTVFGGRRIYVSDTDQLELKPCRWGMEIRTTYAGNEGKVLVVPWSNVRAYEIREDAPAPEEEITLVKKAQPKAVKANA